MKALLYSLLLFTLLSVSNCKKSSTTEDQLPPETTTGAMTFGCKIDGKVFVPKDGNGQPGLYAQYVYLGNGSKEGWHLNIPVTNWSNSNYPTIGIETDSLFVLENMTYNFIKSKVGYASAYYSSGGNQFQMLLIDTGQLIIKKHDIINHILSGTFFFTATNSGGAKVNITDGRFDIKY